MDIKEKLFKILKSNFSNERDELLIDTVIDDKNISKVIEILLKDNDLKNEFFKDINGTKVFKINEFITYLKNKDYLEDSYTSFDNKIGFNIEKELNKKVVLNFPYKDCTLEGGATKDDKTKTNEIFFNEILAKDELKRLREPKVLTNQKRFNANNNDKNTLSLQK